MSDALGSGERRRDDEAHDRIQFETLISDVSALLVAASPEQVEPVIVDALAAYRETPPSAYHALLDRYELRDAAIKVVGVGSVGTAYWVLLLTTGDRDPLFLQVKEARASVLEPYAGKSIFPNHGQRVVDGYRRMQPASDVFLGWSRGPRRDFFIRQLRDMKLSVVVETFRQAEMEIYAGWCGRALALSHARSGNSDMISGYLGKSDAFDTAIAGFSVVYANQNEKDHAALDKAVRKGKVEAVFEEDRCRTIENRRQRRWRRCHIPA